jgi:hypothetical protein
MRQTSNVNWSNINLLGGFTRGITQAQADEWGYQLPLDIDTFW